MKRSATGRTLLFAASVCAAAVLGAFGTYLWATGTFGEGPRTVGPESLALTSDEFRAAAMVGQKKGTGEDFRPNRQIGLIGSRWASVSGRGAETPVGGAEDTTGAALDTLLSYVGTTERGDNRGPAVERFLEHVGLGPGYAYCAAAVSYSLDAPPEGHRPITPQVRSASSQDFANDLMIESDVLMRIGVVPQGFIHVYRKGKGPYGHNGMVQHWRGRCGRTVEANTSKGQYGNQRDGQGVWERRRCYEPQSYFRLIGYSPVMYPTPKGQSRPSRSGQIQVNVTQKHNHSPEYGSVGLRTKQRSGSAFGDPHRGRGVLWRSLVLPRKREEAGGRDRENQTTAGRLQ